MGMNQNI